MFFLLSFSTRHVDRAWAAQFSALSSAIPDVYVAWKYESIGLQLEALVLRRHVTLGWTCVAWQEPGRVLQIRGRVLRI